MPTWCIDHCHENKEFYCSWQSDSFACVKEYGNEPEKKQRKQLRPQLNVWNILRNSFCFHRNFCLRNRTELCNDSNYR